MSAQFQGPDPLAAIVDKLLDCLVDQLAVMGVPVCEASPVPGLRPAWDQCCGGTGCQGQAWVVVKSIVPQLPPGDFMVQSCAWEYQANLELGVLRCSKALSDSGKPPSATVLDNEMKGTLRDARAMRAAIVCCWPTSADLDTGDWRIGNWAPFQPSGGCGGGSTALWVKYVDRCLCP